MIVFDLESTGVDPAKDRIIQFAFLNAVSKETYTSLVNPGGRAITNEVAELTGITNEMVADAPLFQDCADAIMEMIDRQPLITFNGLNFDVPLLAEELERCDRKLNSWGPVIDCSAIFKQHRTSTLSDAYAFYCNLQHTDAHDAEGDVHATLRIFEEQRKQFEPIKAMTLHELAKFSAYDRVPVDPFGHIRLVNGKLVFNHKKVKDVPIADDTGYAGWMLRNDFPESTKRVIREELARIREEGNSEGLF